MLLQNGDLLLWILQEKKIDSFIPLQFAFEYGLRFSACMGGGIVCRFIFLKKFYCDNLIRNTIFPVFFKGIQLFPWFLLG